MREFREIFQQVVAILLLQPFEIEACVVSEFWMFLTVNHSSEWRDRAPSNHNGDLDHVPYSHGEDGLDSRAAHAEIECVARSCPAVVCKPHMVRCREPGISTTIFHSTSYHDPAGDKATAVLGN